MVSEFLVEIWFEARERHWVTKAEEFCPGFPIRPEMESDCYYEEITRLPIRKCKVKISRGFPRFHRQINNVHDGMDNHCEQEVTGTANDTTMPAKIFCSHGSHVTFLDEVRLRYNRCTPRSKATYKGALGEYRTLPRKLVRYGRKPWKPVSVLCNSDWDRLNWTLLTEDCLKIPCADVMEIDKTSKLQTFKSSSVVEHEPKVENHCFKENTRHPETIINKRYKKHSDTVMNMDTAMASLLSKQHFDIDINDTDATQKSWRSPKPHQPTTRNTRSASDGAHQQHVKNEQTNAMVSRKFSTAGQEYRLQRDNIVLHFDSPVLTNKRRKSLDKENSVVRLNSPSSPDDDTALPLTAPIIEKDDIDFGCSPTLPRRRKSSEKREHRKVKIEVNDPKESKEHRKGFWFGKNENKTKTSDENTSANTTAEHKSKFKKQHRKSKSVLVPPTYLDTNPQDKTQTKDKPTHARKSSLGNSPKALTRKLSFGNSPKTRKNSIGSPPKDTKTEKTGLFRRFYASPHTEKKLEERVDDLMTPAKRTRRYTQPVGDIQKEFIRELKGKLEGKYSSEHTIKPVNDSREKVIWNMHI